MNYREWVLNRTKSVITKDRATIHGDPEDSFKTIMDLWNGYLSDILVRPLKKHEVAILMVLLKIARTRNNHLHTDNWVDMIGYGACGFEASIEDVDEFVYENETLKSEDDEIPF